MLHDKAVQDFICSKNVRLWLRNAVFNSRFWAFSGAALLSLILFYWLYGGFFAFSLVLFGVSGKQYTCRVNLTDWLSDCNFSFFLNLQILYYADNIFTLLWTMFVFVQNYVSLVGSQTYSLLKKKANQSINQIFSV